MKAAVLYSGGKDSTLMAFLLQKMGYQVELVTMNFGIYPSYGPARESARNLGFNHNIFEAESSILEKAVSIVIKDGFPNHGINFLHLKSLELVSEKFKVVADGTRRDDRVPKLDKNIIRSFEDRKNVEYINLAGFGHKTINQLVEKIFEIKKEPTSFQNNSDFEIEIRHLISQREGKEFAENLFPPHIQSRVIGWRKK
jgi:predicted subunit of tRNA(5-methylaminomethyl-2-thiouridylate) methyltransferase